MSRSISLVLLVGLVATWPVACARFADAGEVTGRVVTANGVGIPGIDIDVIDPMSGEQIPLLDDDTDTDGSFDFDVPDGRYRIRFQAPDHLPLVSLEFIRWELVGHRQWTVTMEVGAVVTGTVTGPAGVIANADLDFFHLDRETAIYSPTDDTGADGRFRFVVPFEGRYRISAEPRAGNLVAASLETPDPVIADTDLGGIALIAGHVVRGRVEALGAGFAGVNIDAYDMTGNEVPLGPDKTDDNGDFSIVLPDGTFELVARPRLESGFAPARSATVAVSGPATVPTLVVGPAVWLDGRVSDETGNGVGDVRIILNQNGVAVDVTGGTSNPAGDYRLAAPPGIYDVDAVAPRFRALLPERTEAVSLLQSDSLSFVLAPDFTPVLDVYLAAQIVDNGVLVEWTVGSLAEAGGFRLFHSSPESGAPLAEVFHGLLHTTSLPPEVTVTRFGDRATFRARVTAPEFRSGVFWLHALTRSGEVETFGPAAVATEPSAGTPAPARLQVWPNPWRGAGRVRMLSPQAFSGGNSGPLLEVFSVTGRRLHALSGSAASEGDGGWTWDLSGAEIAALPAGIYWLQVRWGGDRVRGKLIKASP